MTKPKIWLSSHHTGINELKYVSQAFETNWIAPLWTHVSSLEQGLQTQTKPMHAVTLSSGT
jgi:dTDP-4-amino-4,6-dideoxygalactose transaminase